MKWFDTYSSNTIGGSGNHYFFTQEEEGCRSGRIYYRVFAGGKYHYSILFSNIMDSTFANGADSHGNLICSEWEIVSAQIGVCSECCAEKAGEIKNFYPVWFHGSRSKTVMPGEFFTSDAVELEAQKGEYICVEIEFTGRMIPNHEQSILPLFVQENGKWISSKKMPVPAMLGCDRNVKAKVGFLGDSITQGCGTAVNGYEHWNALVSEQIGEEYSFWNLGMGFGRAQDAASDGAWLYKAKHVDMLSVCFGINDIGQGRDEEQIKNDLQTIVRKLQKEGIKVLVQTMPPFDHEGIKLTKWQRINEWIRTELSKQADGFFDVVPVLVDGEIESGRTKYCGHPNAEGCRLWAQALTPVLKEFLEKNC